MPVEDDLPRSPSATSATVRRLAPLRTVLVDDNDDLRSLLRKVLSRDGRFTVVGEAGDGAQAVDVVKATQPDLVVLDVGMPVVGGIEALPRLRACAPHTRIVMLSGFSAHEMAPPAYDLGAVGYIEKQVNVVNLPGQLFALAHVLETVQRVLDTTYAADPTSARKARLDLRDALGTKVGDHTVGIVELLTTELVVNSIEHADARATVTVEVHRDKVRVVVSDDGPGVPAHTPASPDDESGRGLAMVDALAERWGVDTSARSKAVWFEVPI